MLREKTVAVHCVNSCEEQCETVCESGDISIHKGIVDEEAKNREGLAGVFRRIHRRHTARKVHERMPYTACGKCGAVAWEHAYDDWYCFRCGNRGYWRGVGVEREFVQGGTHVSIRPILKGEVSDHKGIFDEA